MTMAFSDYLLLILGMGAVTWLPRWLPLVLLSRIEAPRWLRDWLDLIPAAILSALLAPQLLLDEHNQLTFSQPELWVALPTLLFALRTKSLGGTVFVGMGLYWVVKAWGS